MPIDTSSLFTHKYIHTTQSFLTASKCLLYGSNSGRGWGGSSLGGQVLTRRDAPASLAGARGHGRGSERNPFEGVEANKAAVPLSLRSHFNYSGQRPLQGREGHPGLQRGQHVARKELREKREWRGSQRSWTPLSGGPSPARSLPPLTAWAPQVPRL